MFRVFKQSFLPIVVVVCSIVGNTLGDAINLNNGTVAPSHSPWNYENISHWGDIYQVCEVGKRQSPISISTSESVYDKSLNNDPLLFVNYSGLLTGIFFNNGHTIQFSINASVPHSLRPKIIGGGLGNESYILEQFHFHWGNTTEGLSACTGAEHVIDGKSAAAEVHFVHFNSKYQTLARALNFSDGLAVVAFMFEPVNDSKLIREDYSQVLDHVSQIIDADNATVATIDLFPLIPSEARAKDTAVFYRYDGSLTTPPCSEVVTWTVFDYRIPILTTTMDEFEEATTDEVEYEPNTPQLYVHPLMMKNYRPPQPLAGRAVRCNKAAKSLANNDKIEIKHNEGSRHHLKQLKNLHTIFIALIIIATCFHSL